MCIVSYMNRGKIIKIIGKITTDMLIIWYMVYKFGLEQNLPMKYKSSNLIDNFTFLHAGNYDLIHSDINQFKVFRLDINKLSPGLAG